jgi:hypothetical protein
MLSIGHRNRSVRSEKASLLPFLFDVALAFSLALLPTNPSSLLLPFLTPDNPFSTLAITAP